MVEDFKVSEDTQAMFSDYHVSSGNEGYFRFKLAHSSKIKPTAEGWITKIYKQNPLIKEVETTTKSNLADVVIAINDEIFIRLSEQEQQLVVERTFCQIEFDSEKDKIVVAKPNYQEFQGMRVKHTDNLLEAVKLSINSHFEKIQEAEREAKEAAKPPKRKRGERSVN